MKIESTPTKPAPLSLTVLEQHEEKTAKQNLVVKSGVRAGGGGGTLGKFAKYA